MERQADSYAELLNSESNVLETLASKDASWTQRSLAHHTGYSIGLINTILKKLSKTGYIKIANIDKRRLQYLLTPQGFAAASKVASRYILQTVQDYRQLYQQVTQFFEDLYSKGHRNLYVCCDDAELCNLIQLVIKDSNSVANIKFHSTQSDDVTTIHLRGAIVTPSGPKLDLAVQSCNGGAQ